MSPSAGEPPQTPERKLSSSGLAGVFKHLAGGRLNRSPVPVTPSTALSISPVANVFLSRSVGMGDTSTGMELYGALAQNELLFQQLKPGRPFLERIAAAEAFRQVIEMYPLNGVINIWSAAHDLIDQSNPPDVRKAGFELLTTCVKHSDPSAELERRQYFETLSAYWHDDDFALQLAALRQLTNHGKSLGASQYSILPVLNKWLKYWFQLSASARAIIKRELGTKPTGVLLAEKNLAAIFTFTTEVLRFNFPILLEENVVVLLEQVIFVCKKTTAEADIGLSIQIFNAIITYGYVPVQMLRPTIEILCTVIQSIKNLYEASWAAMRNLCRSSLTHSTVSILLDILHEAPQNQSQLNTVRGALMVMENVMTFDKTENLPSVPFAIFIDAVQSSLGINSSRLESEILRTLKVFILDQRHRSMILLEDWTSFIAILIHCTRRYLEGSHSNRDPEPKSKSLRFHASKMEASGSILPPTFLEIILKLEELCREEEFPQKESIIDFFIHIHAQLPDSTVELVVKTYDEKRLCYPSHPNWLSNSKQLLDFFFRSPSRPSSTRLHLLISLKGVYEIVDLMSKSDLNEFLTAIFGGAASESDPAVMEALVAFAVEVARHGDQEPFDIVVKFLRDCVLIVSPSNTSPSPKAASSPLRPTNSGAIIQESPPSVSLPSINNYAAKGLVSIFIHSFCRSTEKACFVFKELLQLAKAETVSADARLTAMKLLFRLRSDCEHAIYLVTSTDSKELAASLCRTAASFAERYHAEDTVQSRLAKADDASSSSARSSRSASVGQPLNRTSARSANGNGRANRLAIPLWMEPDLDPFSSEPAPAMASQFLFSYLESQSQLTTQTEPKSVLCSPQKLSLNLWLEAIIPILQHPGDWEVYSYVLVHLGSQLTNHTLFHGCIPQIKLLRNVLCEQMKVNSFNEPPMASGAKRADVTIPIFHILTMLISYKRHFSKNEEDELVRTFMLGLGSWEKTAKRCIHALSICCYEIPLSISKSLNPLLQRMSQIITQAQVAVHILEFLGTLARMPNLYVNFREEDFRTVFGICFRYLQYVRDQRPKSSARASFVSTRHGAVSRGEYNASLENGNYQSSDDVPQYVYSLAYHVITFWFMSVKLDDRYKYTQWITKNLISTDLYGRESIEEQSQVTLDMMRRVAFSDWDETTADPNFVTSSSRHIESKAWIIGNSIVTVDTATSSGWAQATMRSPSGTMHLSIKPQFQRPPYHKIQSPSEQIGDSKGESSRRAILPSFYLLQMISPMIQTPDGARPILLADDEVTRRAIGAFDRISTLDGHKVGVIYIASGQSQEQEILANVSGSDDYLQLLEGLGTLTKLKGATFNTQGLDREYNTDGEFTFCWRDRVTEIVFHVPTQMPTNLEHDPQCANKKRHTGNDFVNIIFNDSGLPFRFDTFPSDFNYVNIVITPESRPSSIGNRTLFQNDSGDQFYLIQVITKEAFPEISPAAETKIVSLKALPQFVRLLALNASVVSLVWANREGGEHVSSWCSRLREINKLRDRCSSSANSSSSINTVLTTSLSPTFNPAPTSVLGMGNFPSRESSVRDSITTRRTSAGTFMTNESTQRSSMLSTATETDIPEGELLVESCDFSKWV
ncbi:MAG: Tuberous sclerosis 2-like protein [Trizodia sp. TS-e1964]|nr:MAG: Tuberous sclerosis 2-like protein [Trizodia sp. TS-e1964]